MRFDDLRLYNPYHLKDFFGVFSSIDPAIVSDIRIYTGGFPVAFGDRSSGVVDIAPRLPGGGFQGQAVASTVHGRRRRSTAASPMAPATGRSPRGAATWTCSSTSSIRRSASRSTTTSTRTRAAASTTGSRSRRTRSCSTTRSGRSTATRKRRRSPSIATSTTGCAWISARRTGSAAACSPRTRGSKASARGSADLPGVGSGALADERHFTINSLQADGWWRIGARSLLQAGVEWREQEGRYDYVGRGRVRAPVPDAGRALRAVAHARSSACGLPGDQAGAYVNWRFEPCGHDRGRPRPALGPRDAAAAGCVAMEPASRADVAAARGHARCGSAGAAYYQAQGINELQVPDGEIAVPARAARDAPCREHRARPDGVADPARGAVPQGLRPSVRAPREPAEHASSCCRS